MQLSKVNGSARINTKNHARSEIVIIVIMVIEAKYALALIKVTQFGFQNN